MGNNKNKNKAIGNTPLDSICSNSKNSSNRSGTPRKAHLRHSSNRRRNEETYETSGSGEYVPHDPYLYNIIKSTIEANDREEKHKSKGFLARLFWG